MASNPVSVVDVDPAFEARMRDLQEHAQDEAEQRPQGGQVRWFRPTGWSGDLDDYQAMAVPFDRKELNDLYIQAVTGDPPGTTGDLVAAGTQIDLLAIMERAFRQRCTMRRSRAMAHAVGRYTGHANPLGVPIGGMLGHIRSIVKQSKTPGADSDHG